MLHNETLEKKSFNPTSKITTYLQVMVNMIEIIGDYLRTTANFNICF